MDTTGKRRRVRWSARAQQDTNLRYGAEDEQDVALASAFKPHTSAVKLYLGGAFPGLVCWERMVGNDDVGRTILG